MNANWKGSTSSLITSLSLLAKTLAMIRYMELESEMGQKSLTRTAPRHFNRTSKYDLLMHSSPQLPIRNSSKVSNSLMKKTGNPSGPGAPSPFSPLIAESTSCSIKGLTNTSSCSADTLTTPLPYQCHRFGGRTVWSGLLKHNLLPEARRIPPPPPTLAVFGSIASCHLSQGESTLCWHRLPSTTVDAIIVSSPYLLSNLLWPLWL